MARTTHDRQRDHRGKDLDSNIELDGATTTYADGDGLHTVISDIDDRIAAGGGAGGPEDMILGDDSTFASSLGAWTNAGGTMTRDTGVHLPGFTASLKFVVTGAGQYVELPISGTFKAGQQYWFVALYRNSIGTDGALLTFGFIGTDDISESITVGRAGDFQAIAIPWTPTADRTSVSIRVESSSATPQDFYIGWAKAFLSIGLPVLVNDFGSGTNVYLPLRRSGYVSLGPHTNNGFYGLQFAYDNTILIGLQGGVSGLSFAYGNTFQWVEHTPGDLAGVGYEIEVGDDYVGLLISEKNSTTVQLYADWASGYHIELRDRGSTGWETNSGSEITPLANLHYLKHGTVDPSAGGGVASAIGSFYGRNNSGTGELWVKTGASNTAWTKVTIP